MVVGPVGGGVSHKIIQPQVEGRSAAEYLGFEHR